MRRFLGWLAAAATRRPGPVLAVLVVVTSGLGALAPTNEVEVDLTQLSSDDSEATQAMDRLRSDFGDPAAAVQLILDAGPGGDLLTADGLRAMTAAEQIALEALGPAVRTGEDGRPEVRSLPATLAEMPAEQGLEATAVGDDEVGSMVARAMSANPQVAGLVSDDVDPDAGTARGSLIRVLLDDRLTEAERTDAGERARDALEAAPAEALGDVEVTVSSSGLTVVGLLDAVRAEVPRLFALALLVVLSILAMMYRSLFDVAVGFAGLLATVVWTFGLLAWLGPNHLGWVGPLTQLAVIVPVLLVGLGIDYSVHLTARYREQRVAQPPAAAAGRALRTVGVALVLATVATAIGFASIATAPVQMLADFGLAVAIGVVCAFVIMGLGVPAARVLRDRGRSDLPPSTVRGLDLARVMGPPIRLARRRPWAPMGVAAGLTAVSLAAATGLEVEFDRDDFIPEGSEVEAVLAQQEELFGGGVSESTFVVVDGDLTDPAVANALWDSQQAMGDVEGVRAVNGTPQILSVMTLAAAMLEPEAGGPAGDPTLASPTESGAAPDTGPQEPIAQAWTGDGFAADADLEAVYAQLRASVGEELLAQLLAPDASAAVVQARTTGGDAGAERLREELEAAFAPVAETHAEVTVTSEPIIITELSEELSTFQARAITMTLAVVLLLLVGYEAATRRRPLLGAIAMIPATVSAALVFGTMWALGISFNVLTATLAAIAVGIGVPYGVHVVNRFVEEVGTGLADHAVASTLRSTGGALAGSALTTLGAFVVLAFSGLPPIRSLGLLGGAAIAFALLSALLVEPGALILWARHHERRTPRVTVPVAVTVASGRVREQ